MGKLQEKIAPVGFDQWGVSVARDVFKFGVEHGYKEAIALAKEWLIEHIGCDVECNENGEPLADSYIEGRELAIKIVENFESNMSKLWEEQK